MFATLTLFLLTPPELLFREQGVEGRGKGSYSDGRNWTTLSSSDKHCMAYKVRDNEYEIRWTENLD